MCLISTKKIVAKKSGIGYQVVIKRDENTFLSIYTRIKRVKGVTMESKFIKKTANKFHDAQQGYPAGFHVFKSKKHAEKYLHDIFLTSLIRSKAVIVTVEYDDAWLIGKTMQHIPCLLCKKAKILGIA
jgi:hypothetical protein